MTPDRDLTKLNPIFRRKVELRLQEVGNIVFVTEGRRSQARQDELWASGRTKPGKILTHLQHSLHQDGSAIDIAFRGDELYPSQANPIRPHIVQIAKKYGMEWGGDREGFKDYDHLEDNGKPLSITNIAMFYQDLRNQEVGNIAENDRILKKPEDFEKNCQGLTDDQKISELVYLLGVISQRLKK